MFDFGIVVYQPCPCHEGAWYVRLRCGLRLYVGTKDRAIFDD